MTTLPPDSYTARRLEHSTPEHLHATARRAFIGPIPEGWLKSHRKSWYKRYVSGGRTPTFTAARPISGTDAREPVAPESDAADLPRPSSQSAQTNGATADTTASTTSLLHGQRAAAASENETAPETEDAGQSQTDGGHLSQRASSLPLLDQVANKVSTNVPRIRFSESAKHQLRHRAQRLAARGTFKWNKLREGEVLKMDRMLVRMDITQQTVGAAFDERISEGVETKSLDKWREFMIVCRRHSEEDAESVLQLYQTRVIAASAADVGKAKKRPKFDVLLSPRRAHVDLYSSLDKTLCVWTTKNARTTIYYLRPQSSAASVEWYTFLRGILGWKRAQTLQVNVPDLSVCLRLDDPFGIVESSKLLSEAAEGDDTALLRAVNQEQGAAGAIIARCVKMLEASPEWTDVLKAWAQYGRVGLAWKRYDRLEWVYGAIEQRMYGTVAMNKTHELELRPKDHYPLYTKTQDGDRLDEPLPVEGFLIRLTSQKGHERRMGKMLYKRLYFTSQNQYLLFLRPAQATPPPPPKMAVRANGNVPTTKQLVDEVPQSYDVDPYPLEGRHISWLDTEAVKSRADQKAHDNEAAVEADRNVNMLMRCDGFIDLCDVKSVRKMHRGATPADENLEEGPDVEFNTADESQVGTNNSRTDDGDTTEVDDDRVFELVLKNGLIVRLQAHDTTARNLWMVRVRALVHYWHHRAKADMDLFKSVRAQNLTALNIDERAEAQVGSFAYKWEVSQSYASPIMYNMCGIAQCRAIHLSGLLFRKPRRHTTFTRCHVILSHGHLLIFQDTLRARSGQKLVHIHHERIAAIDLQGCYLYSGLLTANDLLYQNKTFDSNAPGHHALPRIYLEDNWTSTDEDAMTTFVIWHAKSKSWFRSSQFVDDVRDREADSARQDGDAAGAKTKTKLTRVSQLGATGRSVVFKARSRAERDHWVMGIQVEIERLAAMERELGTESVTPDSNGSEEGDTGLVGISYYPSIWPTVIARINQSTVKKMLSQMANTALADIDLLGEG
ncbi:hypothetical protein BAUCODRAFT_147983 [Baudoinia panamericana UAMH 10762]|uniref:PH domain-containing protein n=1 Tax=Baudoinia panamericana (strain UAMH 10762) TaxID=717646 RepID=M2MI65_BAUPA|nr:uncharacterized protein BAUCODRAFT_147983 [Baudoinia panamericana UAMH 10762]EMC96356.1 hypothetical protein BAUCODRAFT_147983 [Baudoinia panamericana UAMH 10762]